MAELSITEAATVQFPMVRHAAAIGWTPVAPEDAVRKRSGEANMFFRGELEAALARFNPWMTPDDIRRVIDELEALPADMEGNREMLEWLRGERQKEDKTEKRQRRVQLADFENLDANQLQVTWEWPLRAPTGKGNRADVMFVVNGIPVAIVEHKNPSDRNAIERGVMQLRRYQEDTPRMMGAPQLFNVTHLLEYWYGVTWNATRRFMARWKEAPEETYKFAVQSFFEPTEFLRTLQHWILFYVEDGETRKSVLRRHQRDAIGEVTARCEDPDRLRGLIWHTQGSGKTFTLLTAARLILERKERFHNATVIVIADRRELEAQLQEWVERLLGEMQQQDIPTWRAENKEHLRELLQTDKRGLILSMIHKFNGMGKDVNRRDNVYAFIDEAHRSVARELGSELMAALPNATLIGFTGTPVGNTAQGQGTFKIFGADDQDDYLHKYSIAESMEDETTLPIRYAMAHGEMTAPAERLDKEFFELAGNEDVTDIDELNQVIERAVNLRAFLTADDRVKKAAAAVAEHFRENVRPLGYKAFLVAVNREGCARYKRALDELLPPEWTAAVYTKNNADMERLPLVAELQLSEEREKEVRRSFKKSGEEPQILIVTDKLLTGYDAPLLYCMYLDKPMRDHVLLQALARVNRPYTDANGQAKPAGLVIDFIGVLRDLKKALRFDSNDVELGNVLQDLELLMQDFLKKTAAAKKNYLEDDGAGTPDERLEKLVYGRFLDQEERQAFFDAYKEIEVLWEILSPDARLQEHIEAFGRLARLYATVRNAYAKRTGFSADLARKTKRLVQESVDQEGMDRLTEPIDFNLETLEALENQPGLKEAKVFNLVRGLCEEEASRGEEAPLLRSVREEAEGILKEIESRQQGPDEALENLRALAAEKEKALAEEQDNGLSPRGGAVLWKLKKNADLAAAGVSPVDLAREIDDKLKRFPNADFNPEEKRRLRIELYEPLLNLERDVRSRLVDEITAVLHNAEEY